MSLNALPSIASSSRPRTGTRSPSRPFAIHVAASASDRTVRTIERPSKYATSVTRASETISPRSSWLRAASSHRRSSGLRAEHREPDNRVVGDSRSDERAEMLSADRYRLQLAQAAATRPTTAC